MRKIILYIKLKKFIFIPVAVVLLIILIFVLKKNGSSSDIFVVKQADFVKEVSISGKVVASEKVDLAFETSGTVSYVNKKVGDRVNIGDTIVSLDSRELQVSREKANADLLAAISELNKLKSSGSSNEATVLINQRQVYDSIVNAYTTADDVIHNKVDQYFTNGTSVNPEINYSFDDYFENRSIINAQRLLVEEELDEWLVEINMYSADNYPLSLLSNARNHLSLIKTFLNILAPAVNTFNTSSTLTQATIDTYKSDLSTARSNINTAISNLSAAEEKLTGSTLDIPVQEAKVLAAQASIDSLNVQISKRSIVTPISGIIALVEAKVGESVSANTKIVSVLSDSMEVEVFIPEINIPGVKVGNSVNVDLDAYPGSQILAEVISIDPAETIKDGVSTYKTTLSLDNTDKKALPGMTANARIEIEKRSEVVMVPQRAVKTEGDKSYVNLKIGSQSNKIEVQLGDKDSYGNVEVLGGLNVGDEIMVEPL